MADGEIEPIIYPASCCLCSTAQVLNRLMQASQDIFGSDDGVIALCSAFGAEILECNGQ